MPRYFSAKSIYVTVVIGDELQRNQEFLDGNLFMKLFCRVDRFYSPEVTNSLFLALVCEVKICMYIVKKAFGM